MRLFMTVMVFVLLSGCKFKEMLDNDFQSESKITPIAPAESLSERFGDGESTSYTLKIPLSESSIGYFDIDEVLGNEDLNRDNYNIFTRIKNGFKRALFNLVVKLGISNKVKFSTYFELPEIDPKYIQSAQVKKVFFTTEDCRPEESDCNDIQSRSSNFNFVDTFFVNILSEDEPEGITDDDLIQEVSSAEFESAVSRSFSQNLTTASDKLLGFNAETEEIVANNEINILKFSNVVPQIDLDTSQIRDDDRDLTFHVRKDKTRLKNYFKLERFSHLIKRAFAVREGVRIQLYRDAKPSEIFKIISKDQSPLTQKMMIFRLKGKYIEAKKYFQHERFKPFVEDTTMIGRSLFVELKKPEMKSEFIKMLSASDHNAIQHFDLFKMQTCAASNCLVLDALPVNMAPLLNSGKDVRIDTWIEVRTLSSVDFKYNGYIEVEIVLRNLPI